MFLARVYVTLKPTVNDPQGLTVKGGLNAMGFSLVEAVRIGKYMELILDVSNEKDASNHVTEMCKNLLANPVIEQFRFDIEPLVPRTS